jgi:hypothetical protein
LGRISGEHAFHGFSDALVEIRTTLYQPHFTSHGNGAPESWSSRILAGANCSQENPSDRNLGLSAYGGTSYFNVKTNFNLKINVIRKYFELQIYPTKPSLDLPNLVRPKVGIAIF